MRTIVLAALCAALLVAPAVAQPHGKGGGPPAAAAPGPSVTVSITIPAPNQTAIRQYYTRQAAGGHCPPGLAKKNNGCLPPGQAKKWAMGRPLPGAVAYVALPQGLLAVMIPAPAGYQYAQVANDVLLIAIGTRMVVDAVQDLIRN
ncbi:MAG: hypothetical protein IPK81_24685 [Rhodospirillales bacterium]|nr:MAG: hypothetical protein IPK81_24685 [Rhodospirillales bacterium]